MMISIYDDIISYSLLLQIEDALTRKETWTFLVDYGSGNGLKHKLMNILKAPDNDLNK